MALEQGEALTEEEAAQEREDAIKEIYGNESTAADDAPGTAIDTNEPDPKPEPKPKDIWEGVDPAIKEQFDGMAAKLAGVDSLTERLKQAESRLGAITNEQATAKKEAEKLAAQKKDAPTDKDIEDAATSDEEWEALKEEFPVWAKAIEGKFKAENKTVTALQEKLTALESQKGSAGGENVEALQKEVQSVKLMVVAVAHKDWKTVKDQPDFKSFATSTDENKALYASKDPLDAIELLDRFKAEKKPSAKTAAQIKADREARLKQSQTPSTGTPRQGPKSDADMTDAEVRAQEANRIFAD